MSDSISTYSKDKCDRCDKGWTDGTQVKVGYAELLSSDYLKDGSTIREYGDTYAGSYRFCKSCLEKIKQQRAWGWVILTLFFLFLFLLFGNIENDPIWPNLVLVLGAFMILLIAGLSQIISYSNLESLAISLSIKEHNSGLFSSSKRKYVRGRGIYSTKVETIEVYSLKEWENLKSRLQIKKRS